MPIYTIYSAQVRFIYTRERLINRMIDLFIPYPRARATVPSTLPRSRGSVGSFPYTPYTVSNAHGGLESKTKTTYILYFHLHQKFWDYAYAVSRLDPQPRFSKPYGLTSGWHWFHTTTRLFVQRYFHPCFLRAKKNMYGQNSNTDILLSLY